MSQFMKNRHMAPSSMRTDGHDEANIRFSQFCERVVIEASHLGC